MTAEGIAVRCTHTTRHVLDSGGTYLCAAPRKFFAAPQNLTSPLKNKHNRILSIKSKICPDPINQLGFSKGAQTFDHILTLKTIISKYKKLKQPVYAVFVDFRKAFDSVCREALFYKLANQGISGKIFNILKHMYANSSGQIKLAGHLSKKFGIQKGTEQ